MTEIISVRFRPGGKQYYFAPAGLTVAEGRGVIVETGKGLEYGTCVRRNTMVEDGAVVQPLRPVVRLANERDERQVRENRGREKEALRPWFVDVITIDEWFGYGPGSSKMRVYRYHASPGSKEALLSCCHDIFFRYAPSTKHPDRPNRYRGTLSDLCIFSRGKLFFGSISHEHECFLYPLDEDMAREAEVMDCWGPCPWRDERSRLDMEKYDWKDLGPLDDKFWNPKLAGAVLQCTSKSWRPFMRSCWNGPQWNGAPNGCGCARKRPVWS